MDTAERLARIEKRRAQIAAERARQPAEPTARTLQATLSRLQQRWEDRGGQPRSSTARLTPEQAEAAETALAACKVPARYRTPKTRTGEEAEAMATLAETARPGTGAVVLLCGGAGTGKTQMACEVLLAACRQGRSGLYARAWDFLLELKGSFDKPEKGPEIIGKYSRVGMLVIDEWHRRSQGAWSAEQLWNVVDRRYADLRPTIIVSNGTAAQIAETFDAAMWDRINEDGGVIECGWKSHRETQ